jgi:hypothetical protein
MLNLAITPLVIAGLAGLLFGVRYMRREAYLPYHAAVAFRSSFSACSGSSAEDLQPSA